MSNGMRNIQELFVSPELYPLRIDFASRFVTFVRMTRHAYEACLFASFRGARRFGGELSEVRLDDVLLASERAHPLKRTTYILHTAYCCSTLLAHYFELFPSSFVLQEPPLLAQIANTTHLSAVEWNEALDVSIRLLTRTFDPGDLPVIKTHVPCNMIGHQLLEHNPLSSVVYLFTPLRSFLLDVLKSEKRRQRIRIWSKEASREVSRCPHLADIAADQLDDARVAAYWWLATRFLCEELCSTSYGRRVIVVDGEELAKAPERVVPLLLKWYGLSPSEEQLQQILMDPSVHTHSKHRGKPFDISDLQAERNSLETDYGAEADGAMNWMAARGLNPSLPTAGVVEPTCSTPSFYALQRRGDRKAPSI
jgi:hypothetical protein